MKQIGYYMLNMLCVNYIIDLSEDEVDSSNRRFSMLL